jgi:hypothetical protein
MSETNDDEGGLARPSPGSEARVVLDGEALVEVNKIDTAAVKRRLPSAASIAAVLGLLSIGVAFPLALGAVSGSLFIPSNDDPTYRRVAMDLYSNGHLEYNGWSSMTLIGQIFFVQPFLWLSGGAAWAFTASTAILASIGIVAGYALLRRVLSVPRSALAMLGVLIFPGFVLNTTSYMTDVPAWAMSVTCLSLGAGAFDRTGYRRWLWLAASLAVGCFAFSIREFALAAPVAVLFVFAFSFPGGRLGYWVAVIATAATLCAIYLFAIHLPYHGGVQVTLLNLSLAALRRTFDNSLRHGFASVALVISPVLVIVIASWWRRWRVIDVLAGVAVGLVAYVGPIVQIVHTGHWPQILAGNLLGVGGSLGTAALYGARPALFAEPWWHLINGAALISALVLTGVCGGTFGAYLRGVIRRQQDGQSRRAFWPWPSSAWTLIVVFLALYSAGIAVWSMTFTFFDRYTWPVVLPLYAILLRPRASDVKHEARSNQETRTGWELALERLRRGSAPALAGLLIASLAAISLVLLVNTDAYATARWHMGDTAVERGAAPGSVDAGWEWVSFHATGSANVSAPVPAFGSRYETYWPSFHLCALVSNAPVTNSTAQLEYVDMKAYRLLFFGGPWEPLYLYRITGPGCP